MPPRSSSVVVILSTFNGSCYLSEQLNSLINQSYQNVRIIVRDDGSKDETCEILADFSREYERVEVFPEHNIGVVGSFLRLLELVPSETDYVALCDQDDVWNEDKIGRAIALIGEMESVSPAMYCGATEVVDEDLNHMRFEKLAKRELSLENALVQNVAIGCTTMINQAALRLVTSKTVSASEVLMHDWWLYQVISAFGTVIFDESPKIKYRQHGANVIGSSSGIQLWVNRIKRQFGRNNSAIRRQATELIRVYGSEMCRQKHQLIEEFLDQTMGESIRGRISYALRTSVYRQSLVDDLILRMLIVFSRI